MRMLPLLAILLLQDEGVSLNYGGKRGDSVPTRGEATLTLSIDGSELLTNMIRSAMEFLSFNRIHIRGQGSRRIVKTGRKGTEIKVEYDAARVDGSYDDEPYEFDFDRTAMPPLLEQDKLKQICWALSMGGPQFTVGPKGEYTGNDRNQEAWGEALDYVLNAPLRMPDREVKAGDEWTVAWTGARKQKDNGGRFQFEQKAKVEAIDGRRVSITFATTGALDIPPEKRRPNADKEETLFEAKGTARFDLDRGIIVAATTKGSVVAQAAGSDPGSGQAHELKIAFGVESSFSEPD